jgi:predicted enzyme related to lactoylglutathione lyase
MPTFGNGKICYMELPALEVQRSAEFYSQVFGWQTRMRVDGAIAFDDAVGRGQWHLGAGPGAFSCCRHPHYIMVDDAGAAVRAVVEHGGEVVQPIGVDAPEITARFRDPAGNVLGIYQQPR